MYELRNEAQTDSLALVSYCSSNVGGLPVLSEIKFGYNQAREYFGSIALTTEEFELWTLDGKSRITGQIDRPKRCGSNRCPFVIIVPGGWFMDRDGLLGNTDTERDFVYRDMALVFLDAGLAVVRYDTRGVRGNERTMSPCEEGASEVEISSRYIESCIDSDARRSITPQTQVDDLKQVWRFAEEHSWLDPNRAMLWAHSEGGLHTARLIGQADISPLAVQIVGTAVESPAAVFRWQIIDQFTARVMGWDADQDGLVTIADIERSYHTDPVFAGFGGPIETLEAATDGWTTQSLNELFTSEYEELKAEALAKPDDDPYPDAAGKVPLVVASQRWWKQWFTDETPVIDHLADFRRQVTFHVGEIDSQLPAGRQVEFAEERIGNGSFAAPPRVVCHTHRGHALRTDEPSLGPIDHDIRELLVDEMLAVL